MKTLLIILLPFLALGQNVSVLAKGGGTVAGITEEDFRVAPAGMLALFNQFDSSASIISASAGYVDRSLFYGLGYGRMVSRRASVHFTAMAFPDDDTRDDRTKLSMGGELSIYWKAWQRQGLALMVTTAHSLTDEAIYLNLAIALKYNLYYENNGKD